MARISAMFLSFASIGAVATLAHYVVLVFAVETGIASVLTASAAGALCGAAVSYALNYRFTFHSELPHRTTIPRFLVIAAAAFVLNLGLMVLLHSQLGLPYLLAQASTTVLILIFTFGANLLWTFR